MTVQGLSERPTAPFLLYIFNARPGRQRQSKSSTRSRKCCPRLEGEHSTLDRRRYPARIARRRYGASDRRRRVYARVDDRFWLSWVVLLFFFFFAQLLGHVHSGRDGAARYPLVRLRRCNLPQFQHRQSILDGAHDSDRFRGSTTLSSSSRTSTAISKTAEAPYEAALKGSSEIGFTVLSISFLADCGFHSTAADGRHYRPAVTASFALTVTASIAVSALVVVDTRAYALLAVS